jgi:hypothetical protein
MVLPKFPIGQKLLLHIQHVTLATDDKPTCASSILPNERMSILGERLVHYKIIRKLA